MNISEIVGDSRRLWKLVNISLLRNVQVPDIFEHLPLRHMLLIKWTCKSFYFFFRFWEHQSSVEILHFVFVLFLFVCLFVFLLPRQKEIRAQRCHFGAPESCFPSGSSSYAFGYWSNFSDSKPIVADRYQLEASNISPHKDRSRVFAILQHWYPCCIAIVIQTFSHESARTQWVQHPSYLLYLNVLFAFGISRTSPRVVVCRITSVYDLIQFVWDRKI